VEGVDGLSRRLAHNQSPWVAAQSGATRGHRYLAEVSEDGRRLRLFAQGAAGIILGVMPPAQGRAGDTAPVQGLGGARMRLNDVRAGLLRLRRQLQVQQTPRCIEPGAALQLCLHG
jgi:hypothetical protein